MVAEVLPFRGRRAAPPPLPPDIPFGAAVRLRSGGPCMLAGQRPPASNVPTGPLPARECYWLEASGDLQHATFLDAQLELLAEGTPVDDGPRTAAR